MNDTAQQPAVPAPPPPPTGLEGRRAQLLLGLGFAVLLVAIITLVVVITNDDDSSVTSESSTTSTEAPRTSGTEAAGDGSSTSSTAPSGDGDDSEMRPVIIADGYLLGYWDGIDWIPLTVDVDGEALPNPGVADGTPYFFVDATGGELRTALGEIEPGCYLGNNWAVVDEATFGRVGIPLGFDALPRTVDEIEPADEHEAAVRAWLISEGEEHPVAMIDRVLRVDIEGDGRDEVFIEASFNADGGFHEEPGAYSVLLFRYLDDDDEVRTVVVGGDYVSQDEVDSEFGIAFTHRILGVLDLNEDGRLELVTKSGFYEGEAVTVSIIYSPNFVEVLSTGCGA